MVVWLVGGLVGWLVVWLVGWSLGWLVGSLLHLEEQGKAGEADATGHILVEEEASKCSN